ncbi:MAG: cyclohexanone monooxygenase [Rhodospirillaceae bacterium]|nr:cyclohexanone monooxygenase [Rhodospirillaceae bacterium]|tara:strand:+ start:178 stop:1767 length:1590 start_codon:yes stop_codon:yes gene_type:complete
MTQHDAIVVGTGFAGLYMLHRLHAQGLNAIVLEQGSDVGGTWYWNRYPGARCDNESLGYSYSFLPDLDQEWSWPERYSEQPVILRYLNTVADRLDLRRDIRFDTRVEAARFDEQSSTWAVSTAQGETLTARYLVMATGCLSVPNWPEIPGRDDFDGDVLHTALWPHEDYDFTGKTVAVIGTGSTAIQSIPKIAEQARTLTVFQRTANHCVPAQNMPMDPEVEAERKAHYPEIRAKSRLTRSGDFVPQGEVTLMALSSDKQQRILEDCWQQGGFYTQYPFNDVLTDPNANAIVTAFSHDQIRKRVKDPAVAELLCAKDHPFGTKRLCADTNYFETYNLDHVHLVNLKSTPIKAITASGIRTSARDHEVDVIVFATGFDAMTGALTSIDIEGRDGLRLRDKWAEGTRALLGVAMNGFPNLFTVTGPGSPSVMINVVPAIEQHVEWIDRCIDWMEQRGAQTIEPEARAEDAWVEHVNETANATLFPQANSWYMGANIPGKPRMFMPYVGGLGDFRRRCDEIADEGYSGFAVT